MEQLGRLPVPLGVFKLSESVDKHASRPETLADAQVARWQSKYGRDPTDHSDRGLVVNNLKIRTDIAMMGIKLNAH